MDRSLYVAMSGAKQILLAQASNANNLANANTPAFRADFEQFRSQPLWGPGHPTRVYASAERPGVDLTFGTVHTTGRDLDVAINGPGWIAVQAQDGTEAYTRAGHLEITPEGRLVTSDGLPVVGNGGPISIPQAGKVEIGSDGTLSILPQEATAAALAVIDRIKLVRIDDLEMEKGADGLMRPRHGGPIEASADVRLIAGSLETSNVNPVAEMVDMIELQRRFELQMKVMKAIDENAASGSEIMRVG